MLKAAKEKFNEMRTATARLKRAERTIKKLWKVIAQKDKELSDLSTLIDCATQTLHGVWVDEIANQFGGMDLEKTELMRAIHSVFRDDEPMIKCTTCGWMGPRSRHYEQQGFPVHEIQENLHGVF